MAVVKTYSIRSTANLAALRLRTPKRQFLILYAASFCDSVIVLQALILAAFSVALSEYLAVRFRLLRIDKLLPIVRVTLPMLPCFLSEIFFSKALNGGLIFSGGGTFKRSHLDCTKVSARVPAPR